MITLSVEYCHRLSGNDFEKAGGRRSYGVVSLHTGINVILKAFIDRPSWAGSPCHLCSVNFKILNYDLAQYTTDNALKTFI